jgi:hypothetical protein
MGLRAVVNKIVFELKVHIYFLFASQRGEPAMKKFAQQLDD